MYIHSLIINNFHRGNLYPSKKHANVGKGTLKRGGYHFLVSMIRRWIWLDMKFFIKNTYFDFRY